MSGFWIEAFRLVLSPKGLLLFSWPSRPFFFLLLGKDTHCTILFDVFPLAQQLPMEKFLCILAFGHSFFPTIFPSQGANDDKFFRLFFY